jgi:hypothetical protein
MTKQPSSEEWHIAVGLYINCRVNRPLILRVNNLSHSMIRNREKNEIFFGSNHRVSNRRPLRPKVVLSDLGYEISSLDRSATTAPFIVSDYLTNKNYKTW